MSQYLRFCTLAGDGSTGTIDLSNLRCRFEIHQKPLQAPSQGIFKVTNLSAAHALQFVKKEYAQISLDVGYQDGHGVIFKGNIVQGIYGRESPTDTLTTIVAADGDHAHNYATVNTKLPPGSTPQQHLSVAMQAMGKYGVTQGFIGPDLSKPVYTRAVTLWGMARDVIANIAKSKNCVAYYRDQQLRMVQNGGSVPGGTVVLNSTSGLIGMPTQTTEGIYARCLINPAIKQHTQVYIDQKDVIGGIAPLDNLGSNAVSMAAMPSIAADGMYTVMKIDTIGDTRGDPWYMDLAMLPTNAPQGITQLATQYGGAPQSQAPTLGPEG